MIYPVVMSRESAVQQAINAGFPYRQCQEFLGDYKYRQHQHEASKRISPLIQTGGIILICGTKGNGKTSLGCSYGYTWYLRGFSKKHGKARYFRTTGLLNQQKEWFKTHLGESPMDKATECGLLILDELLSTHESTYDKNTLRELLDVRYSAKRATILVTNLSTEGLRNALVEATLDRILDGGAFIEITEKSIRSEK